MTKGNKASEKALILLIIITDAQDTVTSVRRNAIGFNCFFSIPLDDKRVNINNNAIKKSAIVISYFPNDGILSLVKLKKKMKLSSNK